jgi:hypothetical protein
MGKYNEAGKEVSTSVFPFKLRFHPNKAVSSLIPNTEPVDDMAYTS